MNMPLLHVALTSIKAQNVRSVFVTFMLESDVEVVSLAIFLYGFLNSSIAFNISPVIINIAINN